MAHATGTPEAVAASKVDKAAIHMLFEKIAPATDESSEHESSLYFSRIEKYAKDHPEGYSKAYDNWKNTIEGQYLSRFRGSTKGTGRGKLGVIVALDCVVLPLVFVLVLVLFGMPWYVTLGIVAALEACGLVAIVVM